MAKETWIIVYFTLWMHCVTSAPPRFSAIGRPSSTEAPVGYTTKKPYTPTQWKTTIRLNPRYLSCSEKSKIEVFTKNEEGKLVLIGEKNCDRFNTSKKSSGDSRSEPNGFDIYEVFRFFSKPEHLSNIKTTFDKLRSLEEEKNRTETIPKPKIGKLYKDQKNEQLYSNYLNTVKPRPRISVKVQSKPTIKTPVLFPMGAIINRKANDQPLFSKSLKQASIENPHQQNANTLLSNFPNFPFQTESKFFSVNNIFKKNPHPISSLKKSKRSVPTTLASIKTKETIVTPFLNIFLRGLTNGMHQPNANTLSSYSQGSPFQTEPDFSLVKRRLRKIASRLGSLKKSKLPYHTARTLRKVKEILIGLRKLHFRHGLLENSPLLDIFSQGSSNVFNLSGAEVQPSGSFLKCKEDNDAGFSNRLCIRRNVKYPVGTTRRNREKRGLTNEILFIMLSKNSKYYEESKRFLEANDINLQEMERTVTQKLKNGSNFWFSLYAYMHWNFMDVWAVWHAIKKM